MEEAKEEADEEGHEIEGTDTEEIVDLSTIRRGDRFPESKRKSKKKSTIKRHRSEQNMAQAAALNDVKAKLSN